MVKVLQVVSDLNIGGIETNIVNILKYIDRDKFTVDFLINKREPGFYAEAVERLGCNIFMAPSYYDIIGYKRYVKNLLKRGGYDVVHAQNEQMGYLVLKYAKEVGIPVRISHSHSSKLYFDKKYFIKRYFMKRLPNVSTLLVACSNTAGEFMYKGNSFRVLKNGINTKSFAYNESIRLDQRNLLGVDDTTLLVGHVGNFTKSKNYVFIIAMFSKLHNYYSNSKLIFIGDGKERRRVEKLSKNPKWGIKDSVIFVGKTNSIDRFYQAMDVMVLPSISEGFPVSALEAQCSGLRCLFSDRIDRSTALVKGSDFLSIDKGVNDWVDRVVDLGLYVRSDYSDELKKKGYDSEDCAKELQSLYSLALSC